MRSAIIYDSRLSFDGIHPNEKQLLELSMNFDLIDLSNYEIKLNNDYDCLVNLHGKYFIKQGWKYIKAHLRKGRGLVNIGGGTPFSVPVVLRDGNWIKERPQTAYHEEIHIRHAMHVSKERYNSLNVNPDIPVLEGFENCFAIEDTVGMIVQFTYSKDVPRDEGSGGPMDAAMFPLLTGLSDEGRKTAAPVVMIENTKGAYEGGRWIFVNQEIGQAFWQNGGAKLIKKLSDFAGGGGYEIIARPNYASYYPGEQPALLLQWQSFGSRNMNASLKIKVCKDKETVFSKNLDIQLSNEIVYRTIPMDFRVDKGIYTIETEIVPEGEVKRILRNGFWGFDRELLESGENLTCGRDYFIKDGKPLPIVGMTYMQSDVHRKFLYLPNVYLWDRDFNEMKSAGINMVRTGIWTGHRTVMFNDGIASEEILRAIDAMILTAKKHDMPIVFNFFAFTPELWEGVNPYLDPRSIKAQKRFISSIVSRHIKSRGVSWDLINEPSICNPDEHWRPAPNRDYYELALWRSWLKERHGSIEALQERWNCTTEELPSFESISLPEEKDFISKKDHPLPIKGLKIHDYILFTQHILNKWTEEMTRTIRSLGAAQLVTVGQDEALGAKRPSPFFYQETVDYTTNHSWWLMDDLYWDSIFSKTPDKPNLIQETGMMYVQNADSKPRRTEEELRNILERKYALAFAGNNAGAVHWLWNINVYMDNVNEVNIGAIRADGTQKLETDVSYDFGRFIKNTGWLFKGRKEEDIAVIYPYANDFSVRDYSPSSTKRLTRVLGYNMGIPFRAYGEYHLEALKNEKLIILPSPRTIIEKAWEKVIERVREGSILLITGPFSSDEYWNRVEERSDELKMSTVIKNINREEFLEINGSSYKASFGYNKITWIDKEVEMDTDKDELKTIPLGKGKIIWSPLPIEMNDNDDVIEAVYKYALDQAGIHSPFEWIRGYKAGILAKKLEFEEGAVYCFISESARTEDIEIRDKSLGKSYMFRLPGDRSLLFAVDKNGNILETYRNSKVDLS